MADKAETADAGWLPEIIFAVRELGGEAALKDIYHFIYARRQNVPAEFESVVRATIYSHSSDARAFLKGNPDVFYQARRGVWCLRHPEDSIAGHSEQALLTKALSELPQEVFKECFGNYAKLKAAVNLKIAELKRRYNMV